jgi:DNA-binding transcriptional MerR regulator
MDQTPKLRIGELAYRVRVRPELLRAWERRYGLLEPARSEQGFRLYSEVDEWRVRLMQQKLQGGLSASEAAREVLTSESTQADDSFDTPLEFAHQLATALETFDEDRAHDVLDRLLGIHGLERAIRDTLMPYLRELGERWARQEVTVAQEHFASRLLEGRLLALARGWNRGPGRRVVLACPPGEHHTLPLVCFGLVLRSRGWRNVYLGADSPAGTVLMAATTVDADVIVLAAVTPDRYASIAPELREIARKRRLVLAGAGATDEVGAELDVECLQRDPATAGEAFARQFIRDQSGQPVR